MKRDESKLSKKPKTYIGHLISCYAIILIISMFYLLVYLYLITDVAKIIPDNFFIKGIRALQEVTCEVKIFLCLILETSLVICLIRIAAISQMWLSRKLSFTTFITNEKVFAGIRFACFICTLLILISLANYSVLKSCRFFGLVAFCNLFLVGICVQQSIYRKTFRKMPSIIIAFSAVLLYVAVLLIPYPNNKLLGFINGELILSVASRLTIYLASGLIVAALGAVIQSAGKSTLEQVYLSENGNTSEVWPRFKRVRLRLLMRRSFRCTRFMDLFNNCWVTISIIISAACIGIFVPLIQTESNTDLPVSFYLGVLGLGVFLIGVVFHFNASDEGLLKAEYSYVYFYSRYIKKDDVINSSNRWKDYCQVVANIYCSGSGIYSEDEYFHHIWNPALEEINNKNSICRTKILMDVLLVQSNTYKAYFINNNQKDIVNNSRMAADAIQKILNSRSNDDQFLELILYAIESMFETNRQQWAEFFKSINLSFEETVTIIFADICDKYARKQTRCGWNCRGNQFCDTCPFTSQTYQNDEALINRIVFLLSFPFVAKEVAKARWNIDLFKVRNISIQQYYKNLFFTTKEKCTNIELFFKIYDQWILNIPEEFKDFERCCEKACLEIEAIKESSVQERIFEARKFFSPKEWFLEPTTKTIIKSKKLLIILFYG